MATCGSAGCSQAASRAQVNEPFDLRTIVLQPNVEFRTGVVGRYELGDHHHCQLNCLRCCEVEQFEKLLQGQRRRSRWR